MSTMQFNFENYSLGSRKRKKSASVRFDGNIDVDIVLGMPSKNCQFHGICKINPSSNLDYEDFLCSNNYLKNSLKAVLHVDRQKNLIIKFDRNTITAFIEYEYLSEDLFVIAESIETPFFVNDYFGIPFRIKKGVYPVIRGEKYYQIKINP